MGFVWVCLSCVLLWLVWLLCPCRVRRFYVLLRVCLRYSFICLPFFSFCLCVCSSFMLFACFALVVLLSCLVCFCVLVALVVVSFSLTDYTQKERAQRFCPLRPLLSCVVGCFIWLLLCIPRIRQVSARLYRNKVLEKGNLIEYSKLFCVRPCSYLCSSKFVFLLFSYLFLLVGSYFLSPFRLSSLYSVSLSSVCQYS